MRIEKSDRGFETLECSPYLNPLRGYSRLAGQSSAIGDYEDSWERPGSSYLWIGEHHHLDREEVAELVKHLQAWLATGSLALPAEGT